MQVNELTSEAAARGLVVAYERATDETQRSALLAQLMRSLTGSGGAASLPKRSADSEVFEEGALGQTPDGSAMSTYKELSSLAADTGQPELLYRMLGLAQHHALWTSRRAAAFAATALASRTDAASEMQAHLPVLLPRLFRSSHDPSPYAPLLCLCTILSCNSTSRTLLVLKTLPTVELRKPLKAS